MVLSHLEVDTSPIILDESTSVAEAARIMKKEGASTVLVGSDSQHVIGIVTEKDILYRVVAENRGPFKTPLKAIMSSPVISIDGSAAAKDAIALMRNNGIRRVLVTKREEIIGILTIKSIIENNNNNNYRKSVELAEVELPSTVEIKIMCPYCQSIFANKQELSKHIDRLHVGSGLEGDLRQW
jgi:signal-transduction protein with cAMP-binding, CBS, and nucleotidyltransferase domain